MLLFFLSQVEPDFFDPEVLWDNFDREAAVKREVNSLGATIVEAQWAPYVSNDHAVGNLGFLQNTYPGHYVQNTYPGHYGYPASFDGSQVPDFLKVAQSGVCNNVVCSESGSGTGIKLRTRQMHNQPDDMQSRPQGTAHRRIRFQVKMQAGPVECRMRTDSSQGAESHQAVVEVSLSNPFFPPKVISFFFKLEKIFTLGDIKTQTIMLRLCRVRKPLMNIVLPPVIQHTKNLRELVGRLVT